MGQDFTVAINSSRVKSILVQEVIPKMGAESSKRFKRAPAASVKNTAIEQKAPRFKVI